MLLGGSLYLLDVQKQNRISWLHEAQSPEPTQNAAPAIQLSSRLTAPIPTSIPGSELEQRFTEEERLLAEQRRRGTGSIQEAGSAGDPEQSLAEEERLLAAQRERGAASGGESGSAGDLEDGPAEEQRLLEEAVRQAASSNSR